MRDAREKCTCAHSYMILPQSNMYQAVPYLAGTVYYAVGCRRSEFIPFIFSYCIFHLWLAVVVPMVSFCLSLY